MKRTQRTIRNEVEIRGTTLHGGHDVIMRLKPLAADQGIIFSRVDQEDSPQVPASPDYLIVRERRTGLRRGLAEVSTVEHFLAACKGLRIDNVMVELDNEEPPALDGSATGFIELLEKAGVLEQKVMARTFSLEEPVYVREGTSTIVALPAEEDFTLEYHLKLEGHPRQGFTWTFGNGDFQDELAPARTFCLAKEAELLREQGLGKGADYQNTLVLQEDGTAKETDFRFHNEPVRHKTLDLLGDMGLLGVDINTHVIAHRSGHALNGKLVRRIKDQIEKAEMEGDLDYETGIDIREIMKLLPHRYPFLLIDRVVEVDGFRRAVAIKNVTINEPFFQGHWPEQPIMPGVLQLEAMAQLSGVLMLRKLENTGKLAVLWSIDKVKLRGAVIPGDQLRIEVETMRMRSSFGQVSAKAKVSGKVVAEAQLKFTLIDA